MRKILITVFVVVIAVGGGVYLYLSGYFSNKQVTAFDLVPSSALIVFQSSSCNECRASITGSVPFKLADAAITNPFNADSTLNKYRKRILESSKLVVSVHSIKKDDFDVVYYVPADSLPELAPNVADGVHISSRMFNGIKINEISSRGKTLSYAVVEEVVVASFTPFLIEDIIRNRERTGQFRQSIASIANLPRVAEDAGDIYVNLNKLPEILRIFSLDTPPFAQAFGLATALDVKSDQNKFFLTGFASANVKSSEHSLSVFRNQDPVSFDLKNLISIRSIVLTTFGISNGSAFRQDLFEYREPFRATINDTLLVIEKQSNVKIDELFASINNEIGVSTFEEPGSGSVNHAILIETTNTSVWKNTFEKLADKYSVDTVFVEKYGEYELREVPLYRFAEKMFWPLVSGFDQTYYAIFSNYILLADDIEELKHVLNDIEEDETWGKSVAMNRYIGSTLLESNLNIYVNFSHARNRLLHNLQPEWQRFLKTNDGLLQSFRFGAFQFSHLNNSFYTNVSFNTQAVANASTRGNDEKSVTVESGVSSMHAVKSHVNRSDELLVQDSLNDLLLISSAGEVLWKTAVGDRITSEVTQIDFFANGKLQYFFTTQNALHVIDRLGNYVEPYPIYLTGRPINSASVVDYDHSKKYRFLVGDEDGRVSMFDKSGKVLDGWDAHETGGALLAAPAHHRIKGRDFIVAIRKDGVIHLMNRRGEEIRGFPLNVGSKLNGSYALTKGKTLNDTHFIVVTDDGYKLKVSIDGKITGKETLLKTSVNTHFSLVNEERSGSYVILQKDSRQTGILDDTGKGIISNPYIGEHAVLVKFIAAGNGRSYYSLTDREQRLSYIYEGNGQLLTEPPVESAFTEICEGSGDNVKVFTVEGKKIVVRTY